LGCQHKLDEGIALFNSGRFFECHEALEDVWRELRGDERRWMQGIIQVAVALHHYSTGNLAGARSLFARADNKLSDAPAQVLRISVPPLRKAIAWWRSALEKQEPPPPLPHLELRRSR
jgi:uncharacterized protein